MSYVVRKTVLIVLLLLLPTAGVRAFPGGRTLLAVSTAAAAVYGLWQLFSSYNISEKVQQVAVQTTAIQQVQARQETTLNTVQIGVRGVDEKVNGLSKKAEETQKALKEQAAKLSEISDQQQKVADTLGQHTAAFKSVQSGVTTLQEQQAKQGQELGQQIIGAAATVSKEMGEKLLLLELQMKRMTAEEFEKQRAALLQGFQATFDTNIRPLTEKLDRLAVLLAYQQARIEGQRGVGVASTVPLGAVKNVAVSSAAGSCAQSGMRTGQPKQPILQQAVPTAAVVAASLARADAMTPAQAMVLDSSRTRPVTPGDAISGLATPGTNLVPSADSGASISGALWTALGYN